MHFRDILRGGRLAALAFATLLSLVFAGCSGQSAKPAGQSVQPVVQGSVLGTIPALPQPSSLAVRAASEYVGPIVGRDYADQLPHNNVLRDGYAAVFRPNEGDGLSNSAYALFPIGFESFSSKTDFYMDWTVAPVEHSYWFGLANWGEGRWDWMVPTSPFPLLFSVDQMGKYIRDSDSLALLAVVCVGEDMSRLSYLRASWDVPFELEQVLPRSGDTGSEIQMSANVSGDEPLSYIWDFGNAANPSTSNEKSPTVVLAERGLHVCLLTVSGPAGKHSFEFYFIVNDNQHWNHFYEARSSPATSIFAEDCVTDSEDNLIAAGWCSKHIGTSLLIRSLSVLKTAPSGALVWARSWGVEANQFSSQGKGIAVDSENNIYVVGGYQYNGSFAYSSDALIVKLDADGNCLWDRVWNSGLDVPEARSVAVAPDGSIIVVGFSGNSEVEERLDAFILKMSSDGDLIWQKLWEVSQRKWSRRSADVAMDSSGIAHIVVGGIDDFGEGDNSAYLRLDESGTLLSSWSLVDFLAQSIKVSSETAVYLSGYRSSHWPETSFSYIELWKLENTGEPIWAMAHTFKNMEVPSTNVAVGPSGEIGLSISCYADEWYGQVWFHYALIVSGDGSVAWAAAQPRNMSGSRSKLAFESGGGLKAAMSYPFPYCLWQEEEFSFDVAGGELQSLPRSLRSGSGDSTPVLGDTSFLDAGIDLDNEGTDVCISRL